MSGFGWPGSGGGGGRVLLVEEELETDGQFDFQNLSQDYKKLTFECLVRSANASDISSLRMQINGDGTDANYMRTEVVTTGSSLSGSSTADNRIGLIPAENKDANLYARFDFSILEYASLSRYKLARSTYGYQDTSGFVVSTWLNVNPVASITLISGAGNLKSGSIARVYGEE